MNKPGLLFASLRDLNEAVAKARAISVSEAKECELPCIRSRGTWVVTSNLDGMCDPCQQGDCREWPGTLKDILGVVDLVLESYPNVTEIAISGGYDGALSPRAFEDGEYESWLSSWSVVVWRRPV